jgi:hypothetical protein
MKIVIEDYNGNDICSFRIPLLTNNSKFYLDMLEGCSLADIEEDEELNKCMRIQLDRKNK